MPDTPGFFKKVCTSIYTHSHTFTHIHTNTDIRVSGCLKMQLKMDAKFHLGLSTDTVVQYNKEKLKKTSKNDILLSSIVFYGMDY